MANGSPWPILREGGKHAFSFPCAFDTKAHFLELVNRFPIALSPVLVGRIGRVLQILPARKPLEAGVCFCIVRPSCRIQVVMKMLTGLMGDALSVRCLQRADNPKH